MLRAVRVSVIAGMLHPKNGAEFNRPLDVRGSRYLSRFVVVPFPGGLVRSRQHGATQGGSDGSVCSSSCR
jgi:hypothetical protein